MAEPTAPVMVLPLEPIIEEFVAERAVVGWDAIEEFVEAIMALSVPPPTLLLVSTPSTTFADLLARSCLF
jgi:hypothetical protein